MAYVPGYKHDLFVSYAHFDNEPDAQEVRWVSRFQVDLMNALRQRLGVEPAIFFDTRNFEANDQVAILLEHARSSAVFLAIGSPSYVSRSFTIGELTAFCETEQNSNRVVTVELLPIEDEYNHLLLLTRKRTPFWLKNVEEHDIPLRLTPKFNPELYNERLQVLAHQIKKLLAEIRVGKAAPQPAATPPIALMQSVRPSAQPTAQLEQPDRQPASKQTVLLAQTTDDLYDECERVRAYLEQFGVKVLPEGGFPQGGTEFSAAFEAEAARAGIFIQLLGNFASRKPPDLGQTYSQYQFAVAEARGLKILQWRRPDLDLAAVTHRDKPLLEGVDVLAVGLEEFKAEILGLCTVEAKPEAKQVGDCHFFINADRSDKELADQLLALFEHKKDWTAARPLFEGSAKDVTDDLEANLLHCSALVLLYGNAPPAWVRAQMLRYNKLERQRQESPLLKSILLGPPRPKADIAWSGGFQKIDCQDGEIAQQMREIIDRLHR
jgi:hypothetical protein